MSTLFPTADVFAQASATARRLLANSTAAFVGGPVVGTTLRRPMGVSLGDALQIGGAQRITFRCNLADVDALSPAPTLGTDLMITEASGTELDCRLLTREDDPALGESLFTLEVLAP